MRERWRQSLNQIKGREHDSGPYASTLIKDVSRSLDTPIVDLGFHDIRQLLSQDIDAENIVAFVLEIVREDPYAMCPCEEGRYIEVLDFAKNYWARNPEFFEALSNEGILGHYS